MAPAIGHKVFEALTFFFGEKGRTTGALFVGVFRGVNVLCENPSNGLAMATDHLCNVVVGVAKLVCDYDASPLFRCEHRRERSAIQMEKFGFLFYLE
jgi:hypothetical protein